MRERHINVNGLATPAGQVIRHRLNRPGTTSSTGHCTPWPWSGCATTQRYESGEVIRGKKSIRELRQAYPTPPTATLRRVVGSGDLWAIEADFDYDGDRFHVIVIHQYRDGLVVRETSYYAAPFEAPAWRARWVEPAASAAST